MLKSTAHSLIGRIVFFMSICLFLADHAKATPFTTTVPGTGLILPADYPEAGGVAIVIVGVNGNAYYQFSDPQGAFRGFQNNGQPAAFRGNPFTINNPISLDCGFSACVDYFGGGLSNVYVRFTAYDGDTQPGGFDENDISLLLNGINIGSWSGLTTEATNTAGTQSFGFGTGFGNNTFDTGWFNSTNPALFNNILTTGQITTQVFDDDPNDNYWDFRRGNSLGNPDIVTVAPGYELEKTSDTPTFAQVGDQINYTYIVTNIGSVPIRQLTVSDDKIANVSCDKSVIIDTNPGGVADFATCTGTYTVTQDDFDNEEVTNIAQANGVPDFGTLGVLTDTVTVTGPAIAPDISIVKSTTLGAFGEAGTTVPYDILVTNEGDATLRNVSVSDPLLPGLVCEIAELLPDDELTCSGSYTVLQSDVDDFITSATQLSNTATVTANDPNNQTLTETSTVNLDGPAAAPGITVVKTAVQGDFDAVGDVLQFNILITNTGNVSFPGPPTITDALTGGATCPAGPVAPNASITCTASYTVQQPDLDAGEVENVAEAEITIGGVTVEDDDNVIVPAIRTEAFTLDKRLSAASPSSFAAENVQLTYDYVITNTGTVTLDSVSVTDDKVVVTCVPDTVAPGNSITCTSAAYLTMLPDLDAGGVTNTASAEATPRNGAGTINSNTDSVTVPATQTPGLGLQKDAPVLTAAQFQVGEVVTYTFTITNTGNVTITDPLTVTDDKIGSFACGTVPIAPGNTTSCTANYTLQNQDILDGAVVNTASVSDGTTTSDDATATISPTLNPAIGVTKSADLASVTSTSDVITYTFEVENTGDTQILLPAQPVTVNDPRIGAVDCSAQPNPFNPGDTFDCTATTTPTQPEMDAGEVVNMATASFPFTAGGTTSTIISPPSTETVSVTPNPSFTFSKSGPASYSALNESLSYTFSVTNDGNVTLSSVTISDPMIPGLSCVITNLPPTQTDSCTGSYSVQQGDMDSEQILNTATAVAQPAQGSQVTETAQSTANLTPGAGTKSASIVKDAASGSFTAVGEQITYTFTVTNTGTQTLTNLEVTDSLDGSYSCIIPSLAPNIQNSDCTFTYQVQQGDLDSGSILNTGSVSSPEITTASENETVNGPARTASYTFEKSTVDSYAAENDVVNFTFEVENTGNTTLTNIQITDALFTPPLSCTIPSILPGQSDTSTCSGAYAVTQNDVNQGSFTNTASITVDAPPGVTPSGPPTASETVMGPTAQPRVEIVKTASSPTYSSTADSITYNFEVTNTGNVTLTSLVVTDTALGFSCVLDDLDPGDSTTTCSGGVPALQDALNVVQSNIDAGSFSNTAEVNGQSLVGAIPVSDSDSVTVTGPAPNPSITVAKNADDLTPFTMVGDTIDYTYTVTNTGNITITADVTITDDKISNVTCAPIGTGLPPLQQLTCTGTYTVVQADLDAGQVTNIASAQVVQPVIPQNPGDPAFVTVTSPNATETVNADQQPELTLLKRIKSTSPASYDSVGDQIIYEYVVTNTGNVTTTAPITVTDNRIPGTLTCAPAGVVPGQSIICEQSWTADQPALNAGFVTNTATASTVFDGNTEDSNTSQVTANAVQNPSLAVDKQLVSANPNGVFDVGVELTYSYLVSNDGNVTIDGPFTFTDNLTTPTCTPAAPASLAPGGTFTCQATYIMNSSDVALGVVNNVATVSGTFGVTTIVSPADNATYPVAVAPALTLTKVALNGGDVFDDTTDQITYRYTVTNSGNAGLGEDIFVTDDKIGTFLCRAGGPVLAVGATEPCVPDQVYPVSQDDLDVGEVVNEAVANTVFAPGTPNETSVQSAPVSETVTTVENPGLTVAKDVTTGNDPANAGDDLIYTITATNSGNQTLSGVTIADPMLGVLACTVGGNPAPANVVLLPTEQLACTGTYRVTQDDIDAQTLPNTATARGSDPMGASVTGSGSDNHPLAPANSLLEVTKEVIPAPGLDPAFNSAGEIVTFRITVRNAGNITIDGIEVTDNLVPGTCSVGTLLPNQINSDCEFEYTVLQSDVDALNGTAPNFFGGFDNTATATGQPANPGAPEVSDDDEVFVRGPDREPRFGLDKMADVTEVTAAGQVITYTYSVANIGNITLFDQPVVTDDKIGTFNCGTIPGSGLAPLEFITCTAQYTVLQDDMDLGEVVNVATVESTEVPLPADPERARATEEVTAARAPALSLVKTPSILSGARADDIITYTYDVTNTGNVTLGAVTVTDQHRSASGAGPLTIAGDTLLTDAAPTGDSTDAGANGIWDVLKPGDTARFTASYTVTQEDVDTDTTLSNTASVTSESPPGTTPPTGEVTVDVPVVAAGPQIEVTKVADDSDVQTPAQIGDEIVYTITVRNTGNVTLTAPNLTDVLSTANGDPLTIPAPSFTGGDTDGGNDLDLTETWTYTTTFALDQAAIDAGGVSNAVTVTANDPFGTPTTDNLDDPVETTLPQAPRIAVVKAAVFDDGGDGRADEGDEITYSYTVSNEGNVTLFDVTLEETGFAGAGATPVPAVTGGGSDLGGDPAVLDLGIGESMTFQASYTLVQDDLDANGVTNQATATGTTPDDTPINDLSGSTIDDDTPTETEFVSAPGLEATKEVDDSAVQSPAQLGDVISYTLTLVNTGNVSLSDIVVTDTMTRNNGEATALDPAFALMSGDTDGDSELDVTETWVYTATYTLAQADLNAGGLTNSARVDATDPQDAPVFDISDNGIDDDGNIEDDATVTSFDRSEELTVVKSVTETTGLSPGDMVTFSIVATNTGTVDLVGLSVTDSLSRADGTPLTSAAPVPQVVPDPLMPGEDAVWTLTYELTRDDINAGGLVNTATVDGETTDGTPVSDQSTDDDPDTGNNENDPTVFDISVEPGLEVIKTLDDIGNTAGDQAVYTITATNTGNVTLTDLVVTETLTRSDDDATVLSPDSVNFVEADGTPPSPDGTLQPGEAATYRVIYTLVQEDIDAGGVSNSAVVSGLDPTGAPVSDVSDDDGEGEQDPTVATIEQIVSVELTKTASEISIVFPTVNRVSFTLELTNTGNVTQTGLSLTDDLAAFLDPALLLSDTFPIEVTATGFTDGGANPNFDGETDIDTLTGNPTLAPGETGSVTVVLTYSDATGQPAQPNVATATSDQLPEASPSNAVTVALTDTDGDGIPDTLESLTEDRDGDGIPDALDYDPTGYFYCEDDGQILSGGSVSVTGPAGTQTGIGTSSNITIIEDGSAGYFQFFVTAPGTYVINPVYPPSGAPSTTLTDSGTLDATSLLPQNPAALGSGEFGDTGVLADFTPAANPFFLTLVIEAFDPALININLPMTNCSGTPNVLATKTADRDSAVFGESVNYTLTFTNNTSLTYTGASIVDEIPSGLAYTPGSAQIDGVVVEPTRVSRTRLAWPALTIAPGQTITVTYAARVTGQADFGELSNITWMTDATGTIISNQATATIRVEPEHVFDCSDVIGKVFDDRNRNGYQDAPDGRIIDDDIFLDKTGKLTRPAREPVGEPGIPGVRLATVNGTLITTDEYGRFHVPCAELPKDIGSNFTLKLDTRTLPSGYRVTTENPRVVRLTAGKMAKMNFGAALGRVVDIDLSARAFVPGEATPRAELSEGVDGLIGQISKTPSVLRLSYILEKDEDANTARARLRALEKMIRQKWRGKGRYKLDIERIVKRVQ